jgi:two-component sensor histidine kinase/PAS domain-containing protein
MRIVLRVTLLYLFFGVTWVSLSDILLTHVFVEWNTIPNIQLFKEGIFVVLSALFIFSNFGRELRSQIILLRQKNSADLLYLRILKQIQDSVIVFNLTNWKIELISHQTEKFFEFKGSEILSNPALLMDRLHPEDKTRIAEIWTTKLRENSDGLLFRLQFPDGRVKWALENRLYFFNEEDNSERAIAFTLDITDYMQKQAQLEGSLKENETLLTEVHHRVKNNLAVIISFLQLQSFSAPKESAIILEQSIARIKAIALVHEKLYRSKTLSSLLASEYVEGLVENIKLMYLRLDVYIILNIDSRELNLLNAIPLGLMITEMLTNSFRHAFPTKKEARISIDLKIEEDGAMELIYQDNGKGFPENFKFRESESIGMSVIFSLSSQMSGREVEIQSSADKGVLYHFQFKPKAGKNLS